MEDEMFKVSELPEAENINDEDIMMIVQDGINKKIEAKKVGSGTENGESSIVVEDTLESESITNALSAKQGKILNNKIEANNIYSTEEIDTGKVWINGKPLYRKVFQRTLTSSNRNLDLSDLNFEDGFIEWSRISNTVSNVIYIDPLPFLLGSTRLF